jgi:uncharacterized protein (DUF3084 family)
MEERMTKLAEGSAKSLTKPRLRPNQEKLRLTTQRRGTTMKPLMSSRRMTISMLSSGAFCRHRRTYRAL